VAPTAPTPPATASSPPLEPAAVLAPAWTSTRASACLDTRAPPVRSPSAPPAVVVVRTPTDPEVSAWRRKPVSVPRGGVGTHARRRCVGPFPRAPGPVRGMGSARRPRSVPVTRGGGGARARCRRASMEEDRRTMLGIAPGTGCVWRPTRARAWRDTAAIAARSPHATGSPPPMPKSAPDTGTAAKSTAASVPRAGQGPTARLLRVILQGARVKVRPAQPQGCVAVVQGWVGPENFYQGV